MWEWEALEFSCSVTAFLLSYRDCNGFARKQCFPMIRPVLETDAVYYWFIQLLVLMTSWNRVNGQGHSLKNERLRKMDVVRSSLVWTGSMYEKEDRGGEMLQKARVLAARPDALRLMLKTRLVEGEDWHPKVVWFSQDCWGVNAYYVYAHKINKM